MFKPALVTGRPPTPSPIGAFSLTPFPRPQLLVDSLELMLFTDMIFSGLRAVELIFTPGTAPLWLSTHVIILGQVTMDFHIANLADKPGDNGCICLSMVINYVFYQYFTTFEVKSTCVAFLCNDLIYLRMVVTNMLYQYFSAFTVDSTCFAFLCYHNMHGVKMVDKRYLVIGYFRTFWASMLVFFMDVFIVLMHYCLRCRSGI